MWTLTGCELFLGSDKRTYATGIHNRRLGCARFRRGCGSSPGSSYRHHGRRRGDAVLWLAYIHLCFVCNVISFRSPLQHSPTAHGPATFKCPWKAWDACDMELHYCCAGERISSVKSEWQAQIPQFVTGAAQGVDASRVVFAFARDNALPGSRWWKRVNPYTQTPVNAVWLVMFCSAICGLLGFSNAALTSLAG